MRDIVLMGLVLLVLPSALMHTTTAVMLWTWVSIMNPHRLAFGIAHSFPFAMVAAGCAAISLLLTKDPLKIPYKSPVKYLIFFLIWVCITTAMAFYPSESMVQLNKVLKIQLMTVVALAALHERKHIEMFAWVNALSIGFYGFKGGLFTISTGGGSRVWGPPGSFIEGNNELAVALIMAIPLLNYLRLVSPHPWVRRLLLAVSILSAVAAIGTQSRGALLAISAMGFVLWLRSPKKLVAGITVAVMATLLVAFMPSSWGERMNTIQSYEQDGSAMGRINAWMLCFNVAKNHLFGGGFEIYTFEMFARYAPDPLDLHVAHSIYFQVLGEHGFIGLFLFLAIWFYTYKIGTQIRKVAKGRPELDWAYNLAGMCQVAIVGYAVGGAFLSLAYFDLPYNVMVILVCTQRWIEAKRWEVDTRGAFGATAPVARLDLQAGSAPATAHKT